MTKRVALYARVSSERQAKTHTIDSQISILKDRIKSDGNILLKNFEFVDDGYSGSTLLRPQLERLRDAAANNLFDRIYVHSPDRLARNYAYQYLLIEEFNKLNIEIVFLNSPLGNNPETDLLLQVQGIISEYERTKIMERSRRGKIHAARKGSLSVLSRAPYGYRYIEKHDHGMVRYEINEEEAKVIRLLFSLVGNQRMSINAATNKLTAMGFKTPTEKNIRWNRGSVYRLLKNPAYKGAAAFGKTKCIPKRQSLRSRKGHPAQSKSPFSRENRPKNEWIFIPIPAIIDEDLFDRVQKQFEVNKRLKRERKTGARYLLQGLVVCKFCGYGYYGNTATGTTKYNYYACGGSRAYANRPRVCNNQSVHSDQLEEIVWQELKYFLKHPASLEKEYHRRMDELKNFSNDKKREKLNLEKSKIEKTIERLIDSYAEGIIEKVEFEPRIKTYKKKLYQVEQELSELMDAQAQKSKLQLTIESLKEFTNRLDYNLDKADWQMKRDAITTLVKQVEIGKSEVNIVFKLDPSSLKSDSKHFLEDCRGRHDSRITSKK